LTAAGNKNWKGITANPDFTKMMASVYNGKLYQSYDRGTSWTSDGSIDRVGIGATGSSLCPQGTFSSVGLSRCMPCDIGTSTRGSGTAGSDQIVCDVCDSGFSGISSIISLIDIRHASNAGIDPTVSVGIVDLSGTADMTWVEQLAGTISPTVEDDITCWDLNNGALETTIRTKLADSYTLFYYWKPRTFVAATRTLHRGYQGDHWALLFDKRLGFYSNRDAIGKETGYDVSIEWQTLIVTGVASSHGSSIGTSIFFVNGVNIGNVNKVGSGTATFRIGWYDLQPPGFIAVAGVLNQKLTQTEITALHTNLMGPTAMAGCSACPSGKYSALKGNIILCTACKQGYSTPSIGTIRSDDAACSVCASGYSGTSMVV
jgi:hypothetical protein